MKVERIGQTKAEKTEQTKCWHCGHPIGQHEGNVKTGKIRCGMTINGRRCRCRF